MSSTVQKFVGPHHKISIHQREGGFDWEIALVHADPKTGVPYDGFKLFVPLDQWAVSEDGSKLLFMSGQDNSNEIIHCVRADQLPKLFEAARRYALAHRQPPVDVTPAGLSATW